MKLKIWSVNARNAVLPPNKKAAAQLCNVPTVCEVEEEAVAPMEAAPSEAQKPEKSE